MRKTFRWLLIILFFVTILFFVLNTHRVKEMVIKYATTKVHKETGWILEIEDSSFTLPFRWNAKNIRITDPALSQSQPWITIESLQLSLSLRQLWDKNISFHSIRMKNVFLNDLPSRTDQSVSEEKNSTLVPFSISIKLFEIQDLHLSTEISNRLKIPNLPVISLSAGGFMNKETSLISVKGNFTRSDSPAQTSLELTCSQFNEKLLLDLSLKEDPNGLLSRQASLSIPYQISLSAKADEEGANWKGSFVINLNRKDSTSEELAFIGEKGKIEGNFTFSSQDSLNIPSFHAQGDFGSIKGSIEATDEILKAKTKFVGKLFDEPFNLSSNLFWKKDNPNLFTLSDIKTSVKKSPISGKLLISLNDGNLQGDLTAETNSLFIKGLVTFLSDSHLLNFSVKGYGKENSHLEFISEGSWKEAQLNLNILEGKFAKHSFQLQKPLILSLEPNFNSSPLALSIDNGSLNGTFTYLSQKLIGEISLENLSLDLIKTANPDFSNLSGLFNASASISGSLSQLEGEIKMELKETRFMEEAFSTLPSFDVSIHILLFKNHLEASSKIIGIAEAPFTFEAKLPIFLSLVPFKIQTNPNEKISGHLAAEIGVAPFLNLLALDANLKGDASLSIDATGTLASPEINGYANIINGSFESPELGTVFQNIQAKLEGDGKKIVLKELSALDEKNGVITGTGWLELDYEKRFPFNFDFNFDKSRLLRLDLVKATITGKVTLSGNIQETFLKGSLVTDSLKIVIPDHVTAIKTIEVTYINVIPNKMPVVIKKTSKWPINLDIGIEIPEKASINGNHLTSQWKGALTLKGTTQDPLVSGELKIIDGDYNFHGKEFEIHQGTISFAGDFEKATTLYVIASKEIGKITAEVILKGPIKHPSIAFRSNPPLTQREILSWILFNRGLSEITPFQGTQISDSIANLSTDNDDGQPDILERLQKNIGIDTIDIKRNETGDSDTTSVQIGKYITKGVLLTVDKNISTETNKIGIEATVIRDVKIGAEVSDENEGAGQIQLKWRHDY